VVWLLNSVVLVSSSLSPCLHELRVVQQMRRVPAWRLVAGVRKEAASLALCVLRQVGQVVEEAPGVVSEVMRDAEGGGAYRGVMRDAMCGGAYRGVRKAVVEGKW
jgi:hypothetical protein